ncbi:MAG TPA: metallophosphoesterase [Anaerolineales bacterium]|nr:metallophosphoesterase [Anaerolineales bacterium]
MKFLHGILIGLLLAGCTPPVEEITATATLAASSPTPSLTPSPMLTQTSTPSATPPPEGDPVLVGAGDIAHCRSDGDEATASLLDQIPGTVFTTGDNVYPDGTSTEFANCYDTSWGRHKARTYPSVGNHDYHTPDAAGYFDYFGPAAGEPGKGYYSYNLGAWHIIALNSNIPVEAGSPQEQWLRADLAAQPAVCTLAYWHHPRFSSGIRHGSSLSMQPLWQALYDYGADVVLAGHEHNYERFGPQDPGGSADPARGIRQFVIGSGGRSLYPFGAPIANSEVRNNDTYGVLKLTLHPQSYTWEFIPEPGKTFTDSGSAECVRLETSVLPAAAGESGLYTGP